LPFVNLSADPDNEYFSDGLTEELITDLAGVKALHVISRTSSMQLKGTTKGMREIGRALGVRYALSGSARKAGNAVRITAQLTDTSNDEQLWADKFSGTMDDVFDVQERVSRAIVNALRVTLTAAEDSRLADRAIKDPRAFELYLKAQVLVRRYGASVEQVSALLERAIEIEGLTPALRALRAYMWVAQIRAGMSTDPGHLDRAEAEARTLIEVAPQAAYGYSLLGIISYERGDMAGAERFLTEALERDGTDADAWFFRGISLEAAGQQERAIAVGRSFMKADPLAPMAGVFLNTVHWFVGRPHEELAAHEQALLLDVENPIIHWSLGYTYLLLDRRSEARAHADWMQLRVPQMPYTVQLVTLIDAIDGRREQARAGLATIADKSFDAHITFHLSESYAAAGEPVVALRLLEQAVERGFYPHDYIAVHCPFLASLRGTGEFSRIVARAAERIAAFDA
jgi:TolB-like protein/Flp pilus assembly protein TadD